MRPTLRFLTDELIERIIAEARDILCRIGVKIQNAAAVALLADHGARAAGERTCFTQDMLDRALATAPRSFRLFDVLGNPTHDFVGDNVYFTPGSTAINVLDPEANELRQPLTNDYVRYAKAMGGLEHVASQSTAMVPRDVPNAVMDSYRLYLSLLYCEKPVVTGAFTIESFEVMKDFQAAVRGGEQALARKPLTIFSVCPTSPLKWSAVTSQNLLDCARHGIPVEYIAMPLSGLVAPVTLVGTLVQHTAETLSGVALTQLASPGAPALYGGSPAIFDVRYETTPIGAIETQMLCCAYNEIGKRLRLPTQAYVGFSDAKLLDAQAGLESGIGSALAALSGINSISGPGMLDFESAFSLEKLVLDNEICGMTLRMIEGIEPKEDFPALPRFEELLRETHLLISDHTRRYWRREHYIPGPTIDRANRQRWRDEGASTLARRAQAQVARLLEQYRPSRLPDDVKRELTRLMENEARRYGMDRLPRREE